MGKVGSRSVSDSLKYYGLNPVIYIHRMNPDNIKKVREEHLKNKLKPKDERIGLWLYKNVCKKQGQKAKIITLVREPVSRNISAFFQNFERFVGSKYEESNFKINDLINLFLSGYRHDVSLSWFQVEMNQTLGLDIYKYAFSKEKGYLKIEKENFEILILKLEISDITKQIALSNFLNLSDFQLTRENVGNEKNYATTYKDFKSKIRLPSSYMEKMLYSNYTRHFYSQNEIDKFWSSWCEKEMEVQNARCPYNTV